MILKMEENLIRYRNRVRTKIRENLKDYVSNPDTLGKEEDDCLVVKIPELKIPRFSYNLNLDQILNEDLNEDQNQKAVGTPNVTEASDNSSFHLRIGELLDLMVEELRLLRIHPVKRQLTASAEQNYHHLSRYGPEARRNFRQMFRQALKRNIASGNYQPGNPLEFSSRDKRYHASNLKLIESRKAVVINIRKISKAIQSEAAESLTSIMLFNHWANLWLKRNYDEVVNEYILYRERAVVVDDESFYARPSLEGKAKMSNAYFKCWGLLREKYPADAWNSYVFHFTDGGHVQGDESPALYALEEGILQQVNLFSYGRMAKNGSFHNDLQANFGAMPNVKIFSLDDPMKVCQALGINFENGL